MKKLLILPLLFGSSCGVSNDPELITPDPDEYQVISVYAYPVDIEGLCVSRNESPVFVGDFEVPLNSNNGLGCYVSKREGLIIEDLRSNIDEAQMTPLGFTSCVNFEPLREVNQLDSCNP